MRHFSPAFWLVRGIAFCCAISWCVTGKEAAADEAKPLKPAMAHTLRVIVLDPQGKPLADADVKAGIWTREKDFKPTRDYKTGADGAALVELPKTHFIVRLWAGKKPLTTMYAGWEQDELARGASLPPEYTFRLEHGRTAGGRIVDEHGKPIVGAKVQVRLSKNPKPAKSDGRVHYNPWLAEAEDAPTTDADGRWQIDNVPDHPEAELGLLVSHPDYLSDDNWQGLQRAAGITTDMLRKRTATLTLKQGVTVIGWVTDPDGKPIKDAIVVLGDRPLFGPTRREFLTDAEGHFRLPAQAPHETSLTIIARGWAPQLRRINLQAGLPSQDFRLEPGKPIRLQVVDTEGKPVPGAQVSIGAWRRLEALHNIAHPNVRDNGIPRKTNADGVWEWTWAPDDPVKFRIYAEGFASLELDIAGGAAPRTITLTPEHRVTGRVTDAVTGKPVAAFTVVPVNVFRKDFLSADRAKAVPGRNGQLSFLATRTDIPQRLRVEAPGYRTQDGSEFRVGDDAARVQDFRLQPSKPVAGVIVDAEGRPAAKAEVLLATPTQDASLSHDYGNHKSFTDVAGRFAFPDPGEPCTLIARTDAGFVSVELATGALDAGTLRLRPWASIRGQFRDGGRVVRGARIFAEPIRLGGLARPKIDDDLQVLTDTDGRFEFPRVPPGPTSVRVHIGPWKDEGFRSGPHVPLDLKPGERVKLDLGGGGAAVTGKVALTSKNGKLPEGLDCTYSINYLVNRAPGIAPPPEIAALGLDIRGGWREVWQSTFEGLAYTRTLRHWFVKLAPDGSFQISGVPAGEYELVVAVYANPQGGCLVDPLAHQRVRVTVTDADVARGELALSEIAAEVVPVTAVGDTPALTFRRADGSDGKLADYRGKFTVVHFWASWCGPCKQQLPALRRVHERFAARGLATVSLSLDDEGEAWQTALKQLDLPWPQGRLGTHNVSGISSVPAYWVVDLSGKLVAKVAETEELAATLAERLK